METTPHKKVSICNDLTLFNRSFDSELNIYSLAQLSKSSSLNKVTSFESNKNHYGAEFKISGELIGKVVCILEQGDLESTKVKSIFIESMNILLGNFLTNLENNSSIMSVVSSPKILESDNLRNLKSTQIALTKYNFMVNYMLKTNEKAHKCQIYFHATHRGTKEV